MDQLSNSGELHRFQIVYKTVLLQEAAGETVVPDSQPDIERILDWQCTLTVRSRTMENGCVTLEGNVHGTALCLGAGEETPWKLELDVPVTLSAQDEALREAERMTASAALRSGEIRAIQPRRVQLRCEVAAAVEAYKNDVLDFSLQGEEGELETLAASAELGYISSVTEKSFVVSDEVTLPGGAPPIDRLLLTRLDARVRETKPVASKTLLQGEAALELVYLSPGEPELRSASFTIPFSQILDGTEEGFEMASVSLVPASYYVEPLPGLNGTDTVSAELHLTAQVVCLSRREIGYVADAYCLDHPCAITCETQEVCSPFAVTEFSQTLSDTVDLPEKGGEVLFCTASAGLPVFTETAIRVGVVFRAVLRSSGGELSSVIRRLQAEWRRDPEAADCLWTPPAVCDTEALIHGGDLELRCAVTMLCFTAARTTLRFVREVRPETEACAAPEDRPSAVVVRAGERSVWELAKRYGSTVELIETVNPANAPLLLIPRAR